MGQEKTRKGKTLGCGCLGLFAGLVVIVVLAASAYLLDFALKPSGNNGRSDYDGQYAGMAARYPWIRPWLDSLQRAGAVRDTFITVSGGETRLGASGTTRLHAVLIDAPRATPRTAILVPGYTDCAVNMLHFGYIYHRLMGMNLVIPDLRGNGKSGGEAMQMGWRDRTDVLRWLRIADSLHRDSTGHAAMVLHGVSMGGATVMNVSGEPLPQGVKCFVEDCGYTSVWDEFAYELDGMFGLPQFPLLYTASTLCWLKYGWTFGEASPLRQVAKCRKPMLFIHGGNDTYVPTRMVWPLYEAKPAPKQLVVFHGSRHARSYLDHPREYERAITRFVDKWMRQRP